MDESKTADLPTRSYQVGELLDYESTALLLGISVRSLQRLGKGEGSGPGLPDQNVPTVPNRGPRDLPPYWD